MEPGSNLHPVDISKTTQVSDISAQTVTSTSDVNGLPPPASGSAHPTSPEQIETNVQELAAKASTGSVLSKVGESFKEIRIKFAESYKDLGAFKLGGKVLLSIIPGAVSLCGFLAFGAFGSVGKKILGNTNINDAPWYRTVAASIPLFAASSCVFLVVKMANMGLDSIWEKQQGTGMGVGSMVDDYNAHVDGMIEKYLS